MELPQILTNVPDALCANVQRYLEPLQACGALDGLPPSFVGQVAQAISRSPFVGKTLSNQPTLLGQWSESQSALHDGRSELDMSDELSDRLGDCDDELSVMRELRLFRNAQQARIIIRDVCGIASLDEVLVEVSALADVCIQQALSWLDAELSVKYGVPRSKSGERQTLVVLGMGKLGARELNVSSDIDLIFAYPESGQTDHPRKPIDNHQYFAKLGQKLIHVLDKRTQDGFVYRVDMRLRPYGASGALALNYQSFDAYFQTQGREWERFAMIKARAITGSPEACDYLSEQVIKPFVYRKYPDYSSFEALREMKRLIMSEVHRKGGDKNIKLGDGGIREIEFIAQATQLIYGGRDRRLQDTGLQSVFNSLEEAEYLPSAWVQDLLASYRFLRRLEHAIQAYNDEQTQLLPDALERQIAIVEVLGLDTWQSVLDRLNEHRQAVSVVFEEFLYDANEQAGSDESLVSAKELETWLSLWRSEHAEVEDWRLAFERAGYEAPLASAEAIIELHERPRFRTMSSEARDRFEVFLPKLLCELSKEGIANPSQTLERVIKVVQSILGRTIYFVLLNENDGALNQLCRLCSESDWFAEHIAATPIVLDNLLHPETLYNPPQKEELLDELRQSLLRIPEEDLEAQMDCLRHFKQSHMLNVAAAEATGALPVMKVSDYLTWIAQACLESALDIAWHNLEQKHGRPSDVPEPLALEDDGRASACSGFAVIGYGKLGGIELGYSSDLDMVFLYDASDFASTDGGKPINNQQFYTRLGQRLVHILGAQTSQGMCYEVDMRLRPSGNSGMLVSSLKAFEKYQEQDAWTWEHQALVRARFISGDQSLGLRFNAVRHRILAQQREPKALNAEVLKMRNKMHDAAVDKFKSPALADKNIKQGRGGLIDIEFITQYLILAYAQDYPELTQWSDNVRLLESLAETIEVSLPYADLIDAYRVLRSALHRKSLSGISYSEGLNEFPRERDQARAAFEKVFGASGCA